MSVRRRLLQGAVALVLSCPLTAAASGLYFSERGVRPLGRGGAFVAGADDLGAMYYNPAGIYDAGSQFLIDAAWLNFSSDYTRQSLLTQVDPNTGQPIGTFRQTYATVEGTSPVLPIPTIGISYSPHEDWMLAGGVWAPYSAITSYPEEVDGRPAPQRYSLITLDGSALAIIGAWAAWAPTPELRVGAGIEVLAGSFRATKVLSACVPDRFLCAPEQPEWDAMAELTVGPIITPTGNLGVIYEFSPGWRVGGAFQAPFYIRAPAEVNTRLPNAAPFTGAEQVGTEADVAFDLPWSIRLGVEARDLIENLRTELAFTYDRWSMHDEIRIEPDGISLRNVVGFSPDYYIPDIVFPRNFQDSVAIRGGAEYTFPFLGERMSLRAGLGYETSAIPVEYVSALTIDAPKATGAIGGSIHVAEEWRFDLVIAHVFGLDVEVPPEDARIEATNPVDANPPARPNYVNGGIYESRANVFGVGLTYTFEPSPAKRSPDAAAAPAAAAPEEPAPTEQPADEDAPDDAPAEEDVES